jgi:hypothetical protein
MPREVVHWVIVEEACKLLDQQSTLRVRECLLQHKAAAYLGAVIHDAPYYYRFGGRSFEAAAEWLHGRNGEDTFAPLREIAAAIQRSRFTIDERRPLWALLLGMVSHMVTDSVFHPMVFYFTGDYYDPRREQCEDAKRKHRLLEVYLDTWFYAKYPLWNDRKISRLLSALGSQQAPMYELLDTIVGVEALSRRTSRRINGGWRAGVLYQSGIQTLCLSPAAGAFAATLDTLSGGRLGSVTALSSYGRINPERLFAKPLEFKNPIDGKQTSATVEELAHAAAREYAELCGRFEPLVATTAADVETALSGIRGKSLSFGVYGGRPEDASHYSRSGLPLRGMEY